MPSHATALLVEVKGIITEKDDNRVQNEEKIKIIMIGSANHKRESSVVVMQSEMVLRTHLTRMFPTNVTER